MQKGGQQVTLQGFFAENPRVALGFSGGVDSSLLLAAGIRWGTDVRPYFIKSPFQPAFELRDALRLAEELGVDVTVIEHDVLESEVIGANPADRCYHCKRALFGLLQRRAKADGYALIIDGTNASDDAGDRAGMRAIRELSVRSPLQECGLTKDDVRNMSRDLGLFTWDKPAYACLATRVGTGERITAELLARIEAAEDGLFALGFSDFRVRVIHNCARIQLPESQLARVFTEKEAILSALRPHFPAIMLDLEGR